MQLTLNLGIDSTKQKKRKRYRVPTFVNFYTLYQYDRDKYRLLIREWLKTDEGKNRTYETLKSKHNQILEMCYIRDENGNKQKDCDIKHIYRYHTLHKIYNEIYNCVKYEFFRNGKIKLIEGLMYSVDEEQAELLNTWRLPLKTRIKLHIRLLRLLRNKIPVQEAVKQVCCT